MNLGEALRACDTETRALYFAQSAMTRAGNVPSIGSVREQFNTFFATPKSGQGAFNAGALRALPSPSPVRSVPAPIDDEFCAQANLPPLTEAQGREYELNEMREGRANRYERGFLVD